MLGLSWHRRGPSWGQRASGTWQRCPPRWQYPRTRCQSWPTRRQPSSTCRPRYRGRPQWSLLLTLLSLRWGGSGRWAPADQSQYNLIIYKQVHTHLQMQFQKKILTGEAVIGSSPPRGVFTSSPQNCSPIWVSFVLMQRRLGKSQVSNEHYTDNCVSATMVIKKN